MSRGDVRGHSFSVAKHQARKNWGQTVRLDEGNSKFFVTEESKFCVLRVVCGKRRKEEKCCAHIKGIIQPLESSTLSTSTGNQTDNLRNTRLDGHPAHSPVEKHKALQGGVRISTDREALRFL